MNSESRFSYRFEQRVCDVSLGNLKELEFSKEFKGDVEGLPCEFIRRDKGNVRAFERFIERWGHCVVRRAYGGKSKILLLFYQVV